MAIDLKAMSQSQGNVPKANLEDYVVTLYGRGKVGKTSLFFNVVKKKYGDASKGLLAAFEIGYSALKGIHAADINQWADFVSVVDQLVRDHDSLPYKLVGIDTVDIAYKQVCDFVVKRERIKDNKAYKDISDIPWGAGYQMVADAFYQQLERLQKVGIGIWFITHDKDKKFESRDGVSYDQTTVNLPAKARDIVINMSDFVIFIDNAKIQDDEGKIIDQRYIYFRAESSDLEAGSRFKKITPKIEYDTDLFIQTIEKAIQDEVGEDVDIDALKAQQLAEREEKAQEFVQEQEVKVNGTAEELISQIDEKAKSVSSEDRKKVSDGFKQILGGTANYKTVTDTELLQKCVNFLNTL